MRANRLKILFILPIILLPFKLFAQSETGGVENIFSYGVGLRAIGMGGAFTAIKEDATLAYWNPGAMAFNQYKEVTVFGTRTIADTYYFAGFYTNPTMNFGTLSVGGLGLYTGGIQSYDENALPITGVSTDYLHYQILLSYGYNFPFGLGVGATGKIEQMTITEYTGTGGSLDLGVYYNPEPIPWLSVGAVVQDVIGTGIQIASEIEQNTRIYKLGLAGTFNLGEGQTTRLIVALDGRFYWDNYNPGTPQFLYDFSLGGEIAFNDFIMLRVGYRNFSFEDIFQNLPAGLSVGFGIRQWGITLDYAVSFEDSTWQTPADLLMQIGLSYRFGKSVDEQKKIEEEKIVSRIKEAVTQTTKVYEKDIQNLNQQHKSDIQNLNQQHQTDIEKKTEDFNKKVTELTTEGEEKDKEIVQLKTEFEADIASINEQHNLDIQNLNAEHKADIDKKTQEFDQQVAALTTERKEAVAKETDKSKLYASGLQLFSDGQYQEALKQFESVASLDDKYLNVQEYIQLSKAALVDVSSYSPEILDIYNSGVALFAQKKYQEAITEWKKILDIDQYNKLAIRSIKEAEDRLRRLKELGAGE
jgi:tetratricopeptide (TPR) repeat protein